MNYNKDFLPITNICLNITETCNLNCRYCFTEQHEHTMTLQVAKDTAKWLYDNAKITNELNGTNIIPMINFFGGEPTLCFDNIIVPLVEWIAEQGWQFKYGITTNGILLTKEKVDFFLNHNIGVLLSADGAKYTQDYNRPFKYSKNSSFDVLNQNLPYLLEKMPHTTFRATIIPDTANYFFENIMYAASIGFKHFFAIINEFEEWPNEKKNLLEQELFKYALYVIECCKTEIEFIHFHPLEKAFQQIITIYFNELNNIKNINCYNINCNQCGLGNGYGSVNYAGDIFTCQEVASRKERDLFNIGNIYTGIDYSNLFQLQKKVNEIHNKSVNAKCQNCQLSQFCNSHFCLVNNYILTDNLFSQTENICWWNQTLFKYALFIMTVMDSNNNEYFKKYIISLEGGG